MDTFVMHEKWFLISTDGENSILDECYATSHDDAQQIFTLRGWVHGVVVSEADWMNEKIKV